MGKLKFTLSNIWFWLALLFVSFLTENLSLLTDDIHQGFNPTTLAVLSIGCLICLVMYYFVNHKENKMKLDWILLPGIAIVGIALLLGIWLQGNATFEYADGSQTIAVEYSTYEKIRASVVIVLFLGLMYAVTFMMNANRPTNRILKFLAYVGVGAAIVSIVLSLATEMDIYIDMFKGVGITGKYIDSFYGNKNYYGGVLFIGTLTCIILNYYRPRLHWYLLILLFLGVSISITALLPSLILAIAVPVYFLEEVIRFAVKKKWKYCVFALISLLIILVVAILFYWGSKHSWPGFAAIDNFVSKHFKDKNFETLSDRTQIWSLFIPLCFDSPLHAILGHGFMLSEKYILAATEAMRSGILPGVKTTHNGYLETLFDYGLVGLVVHVALVGYFIYCAIRLCLEKRFHFVFTFGFVALCCGVYNFCESSSFFDAGTKEIYMTVLFMMPVIGEYKISHHKEKIEEIKNHPATRKSWDPVKLGQTIAFILMSFLITAGSSLCIAMVYEIPAFKLLMLNVVIGLAIALLFIPYLVTLWYKGDKLYFVLHTVFNGILIPAFLFVVYLFARQDASLYATVPYVLPGLLFLTLLIETIVYSLVRNGSLKEWASVFVRGSFVLNRYALLAGALGTIIPGLIIQMMGEMNYYIFIVCVILGLLAYYATFHFLPTKDGKEILDQCNELAIWNIKRVTLKDEKYYG